MKPQFDKKTKEWFKQHPFAETTVMKCEKCGLEYKPSLGHKCKYAAKQSKTCKDCIHYGVCIWTQVEKKLKEICKYFKNKADYEERKLKRGR